jgi:hypothetical protein
MRWCDQERNAMVKPGRAKVSDRATNATIAHVRSVHADVTWTVHYTQSVHMTMDEMDEEHVMRARLIASRSTRMNV